MRSKPQMTHVFPFCCVQPWSMGGKFLRQTTIGILQYIPIKLLMSIVMLITSLAGVYGEAPLLANFMDAINVTDVSTDLKNSRNEILTKKQALAAKFERLNSSSPGGGMF
ncbi:Small nuclear ribonucleoprotein G [Phytophthora nicotianae]|uniref:Small nuclear ribonucleoprotein G n=1 Tax=Phytophthora nicotianae TaxID=4792 RepID=A0A0W8D519_PHYNI|nr:Small nuclear ribonucleoprotein G [Phytophthora nicotianae]